MRARPVTRPRDRVSALHRHNLSQLTRQDIIVASYGGAGQALVGNLLLELGLNYADAYTEELHRDGTTEEVPAHTGYRARLSGGSARTAPTRRWPRFVKTHLPVHHFAESEFGGVWLLIRDPRDALRSWYNWRRGFAEEEWDKVSGTFADFLTNPDYGGAIPGTDWADFYRDWRDVAAGRPICTTMRFEELKSNPVTVIGSALAATGVQVSAPDLAEAAQRSSYEAMRQREETVAGATGARIMHSGKVSGWREWMTSELAEPFRRPEVVTTATAFGYDVAG